MHCSASLRCASLRGLFLRNDVFTEPQINNKNEKTITYIFHGIDVLHPNSVS